MRGPAPAALLLAITLAGCGGGDGSSVDENRDAVRDVAEDYLSAFSDADAARVCEGS